jgi:TolB protein
MLSKPKFLFLQLCGYKIRFFKLVGIAAFLLLLPCLLRGEDTLHVALPTQSQLALLYRSPIFSQESGFEKIYVQEIQKIFHHDLDQSGVFLVVKEQADMDLLLSRPDPKEAFDPNVWKREKISYVIKAVSSHKEMEVQVYHTPESKVWKFQAELTGRFVEDRQKIHQLCDYIIETLTGKKGVASGRILYTIRVPSNAAQGPKWTSEIWICDRDGSEAHAVTAEKSYALHPLFLSPRNPGDFLYVSYKEGQPKIYHFWGDKKESTPLISLRGNQLLPALSPRADLLAFICDAAGRPDLFLQRLNAKGEAVGQPLQLFSFPRATQASPTFSPDGRKIAFVSDKDGPARVYVVQIPEDISFHKRPEAVLITKKNRENVSPAWSPDGTKIAYSSKTEGVRQIWIYDFQTNEEWQLTKSSGNKENPSWGKDSLHLVYNTDDQNSGELYVIDLNLQVPVKITNGFGKKRFPCWEPF